MERLKVYLYNISNIIRKFLLTYLKISSTILSIERRDEKIWMLLNLT